jgi:signal transduction histidine kinase
MSSTDTLTKISSEQVDSLVQELRGVSLFSDLPEEGLRWMASQMKISTYHVGEPAIREGEPPDRMVVVLGGEFYGRVEKGPDDGRKYVVRAGSVTGMLPYSRMEVFPTTLRASTEGRVATLPAALFEETLRRLPQLHSRFVKILLDRVRAKTTNDQQMDKMAALGKLSAGLAHELNNPAAAATRATEDLRRTFEAMIEATARLDQLSPTAEQRLFLTGIERDRVVRGPAAGLDSLDRADREEEIASWLERHEFVDGWQLAADLVDDGWDLASLDEFAVSFEGDALEYAIRRVNSVAAASRLISEIRSSTSRMSELVRSIKEYSYMDRMPQQEVDVHDGIESTLTMLGHRLRDGINITRDYDRSTPKILAYGSELNQVWTNLIDNAIDAMGGKGELRIHTSREFDHILVEIRDNGPGIPEEIRTRIFEPFFTTKPVGKGTGLGLDTVHRTVEKHQGQILVTSEPGNTRFQVRLPIAATEKKEKPSE